MPTATTATQDSRSKMGQNHPHDFTKRLDFYSRWGLPLEEFISRTITPRHLCGYCLCAFTWQVDLGRGFDGCIVQLLDDFGGCRFG
jgi:hypothetical protein